MLSRLIKKLENHDQHLSYFDKGEVTSEGQGFYYKDKRFVHHSTLSFRETAFKQLSGSQIVFLLSMAVALVIASLINFHETLVFL